MADRWTGALAWVMALVVLLSFAGVGYFALAPAATTDPYTEFYVLGPDGSASGYPTNLSVGESGTVIVGVSNHEGETTTYTVALELGAETVTSRTVTLRDGETWERTVTFTPRSPGRQRLRILLFRGNSTGDGSDPYRSLRLRVRVGDAGT